ncbi:MAG: NAD(P)H-dependent oxidoreductase, partial [Pseudomonadota bacterium]
MSECPNLEPDMLAGVEDERLFPAKRPTHLPRILLLYGSLREHSYSRFLSEEAARLLTHLGAEPKSFDPHGLPLPDDAEITHPKVAELRELVMWSEGMVWVSPERHGA